MLDPEELRWMKTTANELNNLLQVIAESSTLLEKEANATRETERFFSMMRSAVDRAAKVTQTMVDRIGGYSADGTAPRPAPVPESKSEIRRIGDLQIYNPHGPLELLMIVDDEDFVTVLAQRVLADEGYRVITARDGMQAIAFYKKMQDEIALVILDFTMPIMDGADVFDELQLIRKDVPVVLSSGFAEQERLRGMLARGLRGFIPKPYTQQKLLTQIRAVLDSLRAEKTGERRVL
jgi:CheY-like chemotaxis protein